MTISKEEFWNKVGDRKPCEVQRGNVDIYDEGKGRARWIDEIYAVGAVAYVRSYRQVFYCGALLDEQCESFELHTEFVEA